MDSQSILSTGSQKLLNPEFTKIASDSINAIKSTELATLQQQIEDLATSNLSFDTQVRDGKVCISCPDADGNLIEEIRNLLEAFKPWKKGPFEALGTHLDSEWRSDIKWQRLEPYLHLKDQVIADLGCHNGYFMFRMLEQCPKEIHGFEVQMKQYLCFKFLNKLIKANSIHYHPISLEYVDRMGISFDTIFCMGILYHHTDPIKVLRSIHKSLKTKGQVIIDCQGIEGEQPYSLTPQSRYSGMTGVWFLPTLSCLKNWLKRANFREIECIYSDYLTEEEQRSTRWAPIKSLSDGLIGDGEERKTIEGYPPPMRFYVTARR